MRIAFIFVGILVGMLAVGSIVLGLPSTQDFLLKRGLLALMAPSEAQRFDGLKVFMCGTSSPLPDPDRAQACVAVVVGDRIYLVDAGSASAKTANLARLPLQNLQAILLTHYHSDHIADIPDFNLNSWVAGRKQQLQIMGPTGVQEVVSGFNTAYALDRKYRVQHHGADLLPPNLGILTATQIESGVVLSSDGLTITAFPVEHDPISPAVGYRFDYKGRSVVVSGDSIATETLQKASKDADLLLHDAMSLPIMKALEEAAGHYGLTRPMTIFKDVQDYHAQVKNLGPLADKAGVKQLALYHFVPPPRNFVMMGIYKRALPDDAIMTEDGMWFELPEGSSAIDVY